MPVYNEDGEELKYRCPVCGTLAFPYKDSFQGCTKCGWQDDQFQEENPDEDECANHMSLNQARAAYKAGKPIR